MFLVVGLLIGFLLCWLFLKPKSKTLKDYCVTVNQKMWHNGEMQIIEKDLVFNNIMSFSPKNNECNIVLSNGDYIWTVESRDEILSKEV